MSIFRSNNPVYKRALSQAEGAIDISYEASTYAGVARKVLFYIALVVIGAVGESPSWRRTPISSSTC